ncbi:MAG: GNAT family N-acetyltransferase [Eubacteriales bacterium]|nr:GNAT family N-acetyltransferase [Eubacteriales bacterium]
MNEELHLRALSLEQIRLLYEQDMTGQFGEMELRDYQSMVSLSQRGIYKGYGLFCDETLCSYALVAHFPEMDAVLVDYLATPDRFKNKGYGSALLRRLREELFPDGLMLIETEDPEHLSGEQKEFAQRRLGFYARNGFRECGVRVYLFTVWYRFYILGSAGDEQIFATAEAIYRKIVPAHLHKEFVHLYLRGEG